ncbi:MAG: methyltransferase domain-containing protein [Thiomargarita sp.]|nr:methyltransferase domain-containing protein [Thiomargarita sp.]
MSQISCRPRASAYLADAAQLLIADNSIDLLISNMMLQWCNDIQAVFSEFARVLKPDGLMRNIVLQKVFYRQLMKSFMDVGKNRTVF